MWKYFNKEKQSILCFITSYWYLPKFINNTHEFSILPQRRMHDKGDLFVYTESSMNKANAMRSSTIAEAAFLCSTSPCVHIVLRLHDLWSSGGYFIPDSQPEREENHWVKVGRNFNGNKWSRWHSLQQSYQ